MKLIFSFAALIIAGLAAFTALLTRTNLDTTTIILIAVAGFFYLTGIIVILFGVYEAKCASPRCEMIIGTGVAGIIISIILICTITIIQARSKQVRHNDAERYGDARRCVSTAQPVGAKRSAGQLSLSHKYGVATLDSHKYVFYNQRIINDIQIY
jgi:uncharacterized membrane protein YccC